MTKQAFELFFPSLAFAFGAALGSFLNVVIYRLPLADLPEGEVPEPIDEEAGGDPAMTVADWIEEFSPTLFWQALMRWRVVASPKRSFCPPCKAQIAWYDNLPLISYLALGAKCRACKGKIPIRYFLVEFLTACLFAVIVYLTLVRPYLADLPVSLGVTGVHLGLALALVAIGFIDWDHTVIPDAIDKPGLLLGLILAPLVPALHQGHGDLATLGIAVESAGLASLLSAVIGALFGTALIAGVGGLGRLLFKKQAMGFGDVKLMAMLGAFLGWKGVLLTLLVACFAGAFIGIALKAVSGSSYVPFGPFLAIGAMLVLLFRAELLWAILVWYPGLIRGPQPV